jgi:ferric-dicitrate binding protein FerR (iron transport regulator)
MAKTLHRARAAFEAWQQADAHARELESRLASAWRAFEESVGPAPDKRLVSRVGLFRSIACEKLSAVLEEMRPVTGHEPNEVMGGWREPHAN